MNTIVRQANTVDLYYTVCPVPSASSIAIGRGDLAKAFAGTGVNLHNIRKSSERKVREAHYDQTQPGLFREGGNIPPLWARSDGRNLRLIGLTWIEHYASLIALPESNIRTPEDLKGKRIGIVRRPNDTIDYARATALRGILVALKAAGLGYGDVTFVDLSIEEPLVAQEPKPGVLSSSAFSVTRLRKWDSIFVRALFERSVDALFFTAKDAYLQDLLGANVVYDVSQSLDPVDRVSNLTPVAFTVRGELLESHPDVVRDYVLQNLRTAHWSKENPGEAARYIARDTGIPEEAVNIAYSPTAATSLVPSLSDDLLRYLEVQKDFLLEYGFIKNDFRISDFVAHEPLKAAQEILASETNDAGKSKVA